MALNKAVDAPAGPEKMGKFDKYECEEALRTLTKAEEIKADPELMAQVQKLAEKQKKAISSIADLKLRASQIADEEDDQEYRDEKDANGAETVLA